MAGIALGIVAYALSGIAALLDKYLLGGRIPSAAAYAFFVGIFGLGALALAPFGFSVLAPSDLILTLLSGVVFIPALLLFYMALRRSESSRIVPLVGALIPVFVVLAGWWGYGTIPSLPHTVSIAFFVAGGLLLAPRSQLRVDRPIAILALSAAAFFALSFLLLIEVFKTSPFISAFIWSRLGSAAAAVGLILIPSVRQRIFHVARSARHTSYAIFLLNKGIGAGSFFILNYAIAVGPGSVVASLKGIEYLTVIAATFALSRFSPRLLGERFDRNVILLKIAGVLLLTGGFTILAQAA